MLIKIAVFLFSASVSTTYSCSNTYLSHYDSEMFALSERSEKAFIAGVYHLQHSEEKD